MGWQGGVEGGRDRVDGGRKGGCGREGVEEGRDRVDGGRKGGGGREGWRGEGVG